MSVPRSAEARCGFLLRLSYRGAVVVDHPGRCPWLRPRLDVACEFLVGVRRLRVLQEVPEEVPVSEMHHVLGQSRYRKEEEVPGLRSWFGWCSPSWSRRG